MYHIYDTKRVIYNTVSLHSLVCVIRAVLVPSQCTDRIYSIHIVVLKTQQILHAYAQQVKDNRVIV